VPVTVETKLDQRLPTVIETAAYFIVAESLTNVAKHAPGASVRLSVCEVADRLLIDVSDDGPGGADPNGGGLAGLSQRAAALDGTMMVDSRAGSGTTIHVELRCGL
jgi:signal transduction histidine kinase